GCQRLEEVKADALVRKCKCDHAFVFEKSRSVLEKGDQVGKVLAHMRCEKTVEGAVHALWNQAGKRLSLPDEIYRLDAVGPFDAQCCIFFQQLVLGSMIDDNGVPPFGSGHNWAMTWP